MERSKRVNRKIPTFAFARVFALSSDVIVGVQGIFKIKVPQIYQPKKYYYIINEICVVLFVILIWLSDNEKQKVCV